MADHLINSAFKVKVGTVEHTGHIPPERGAIVFSKLDGHIYVGDGFNWLTFETSTLGAAITGSVFLDAMVAATPVVTAEYFDAIEYNLGGAMTISIPAQTIVIDIAGGYQINWLFNASCDVPQTTLHFDILIDGTPFGTGFDVFMKTKNAPVSSGGTLLIPGLLGTEVLTLNMVTNKSCNLTRSAQRVGISKVI